MGKFYLEENSKFSNYLIAVDVQNGVTILTELKKFRKILLTREFYLRRFFCIINREYFNHLIVVYVENAVIVLVKFEQQYARMSDTPLTTTQDVETGVALLVFR